MDIFLFAHQKPKSDQRAKGGGEARSQQWNPAHSARAGAGHKHWAFQKGSNQPTQSWLNVLKCLSDATITWQLGNQVTPQGKKTRAKEMGVQRSAQVVDPHICHAWGGRRGSDRDWETDDDERPEFNTFQTVVTGSLGWVTFDPHHSHLTGARAKNKWSLWDFVCVFSV